MIKRLIAKNFRQFSDLRMDLPSAALLMGNNGSGKSSIFDVLWGIRQLVVDNENCEDAFPISTISRWHAQPGGKNVQQIYSLTIDSPFGDIHYGLAIDQNFGEGKSRIAVESLQDDRGPLFSFDHGVVQLYRDNNSLGPEFSLDWSRSALAGISPTPDNKKLTFFKELMAKLSCIRIDSPRIDARSEKENSRPDREFTNFASWYRFAIQRDVAATGPFLSDVKDAIYGLRSLNLQSLGQGFSILQAQMARTNSEEVLSKTGLGKGRSEYSLSFDELSDGQRSLIVLYAVLHFLIAEKSIVCLDEPESYLALEEVQPFIHRLLDVVAARDAQVLVASHHPKLYNTLAKDYGIRLSRDTQGGITASRYIAPEDSPLPVAELVARGGLQ